jgi:hypothetical protein
VKKSVAVDPYTKLDQLAVKLPCKDCKRCCCERCAVHFGYQSGETFVHDPLASTKRIIMHDTDSDVRTIDTLLWQIQSDESLSPESIAMLNAKIDVLTYDVQFNVLGVNYTFNTRDGFYDSRIGCRLPRQARSEICLGHICQEGARALGRTDYSMWRRTHQIIMRQRCDSEESNVYT